MGIRSIEFRGKTDNGEWVYGGICDYNSGVSIFVVHHYDSGLYEPASTDLDEIEVISKTVGQYTGLKDKNGTKIFEGDIVRLIDKFVDFRTYAVIEFGNPNGLYNWGWQLRPLENKPFAVEILHWVDMEESGAYIEVIGNIHDNQNCWKE